MAALISSTVADAQRFGRYRPPPRPVPDRKPAHEDLIRRSLDIRERLRTTAPVERYHTAHVPVGVSGSKAVAYMWAHNRDWMAARQNQIERSIALSAFTPFKIVPSGNNKSAALRFFFPALFNLDGWQFPAEDVGTKIIGRLNTKKGPVTSIPPSADFTNLRSGIRERVWRAERHSALLNPNLSSKPAIFSALPTTKAQFENVFPSVTPTQLDISSYRRANISLKSAGSIFIGTIDNFFKQESNVLIFVGHNEKGHIKLRNGERLELKKIAEKCQAGSKICIFLVCNGKPWVGPHDIAFGRPITPTEAAKIAHQISLTLSIHKYDNDQLGNLSKLSDILYVTTDKHGIRYFCRRVGDLFLVSLILIVACDDSDCQDLMPRATK